MKEAIVFVAYGFIIKPVKGPFYNHPPLGTGDILKLRKLFPDNPIWQARTSGVGNAYHPTPEQARAFYYALKAYAEAHEVSSEQYPTGNTTGRFLVYSDLKSVFDDLIPFFEDELDLPRTRRTA
ncbi:MAG: hypothetical protein HYS89_00655 [Candidatus Colwellbacteria bacterium]|nr:hypothetical protein [Candidatus Colwellbacteria bacterium]